MEHQQQTVQIIHCPSGSYRNDSFGECSPCPKGHLCLNNTVQPCPPGSFNPFISALLSACLPCPLGTYSENLGLTSKCPQCPAGHVCSNTTHIIQCPMNTVSPEGSTSLTQCVCVAGFTCLFKQTLSLFLKPKFSKQPPNLVLTSTSHPNTPNIYHATHTTISNIDTSRHVTSTQNDISYSNYNLTDPDNLAINHSMTSPHIFQYSNIPTTLTYPSTTSWNTFATSSSTLTTPSQLIPEDEYALTIEQLNSDTQLIQSLIAAIAEIQNVQIQQVKFIGFRVVKEL